jgi:hypothetical protein
MQSKPPSVALIQRVRGEKVGIFADMKFILTCSWLMNNSRYQAAVYCIRRWRKNLYTGAEVLS